MKTKFKFLTVLTLAALMALPAVAGASDSRSTVNKGIRIGDSVTAGSVDSVNGSIRIGSGASVQSIESVNGSVKLSNDVSVERGIEAVNGAISLQAGCEVGGNIESVNGGIRINDTVVAGDVETYNGQLRIMQGSEVTGNVAVRKSRGWNSNKRRKPVHVEIGENVVIHGDLIFEQAVKLELHSSARVGEIIGDDVEMLGES